MADTCCCGHNATRATRCPAAIVALSAIRAPSNWSRFSGLPAGAMESHNTALWPQCYDDEICPCATGRVDIT